jgi:hypothetical protein
VDVTRWRVGVGSMPLLKQMAICFDKGRAGAFLSKIAWATAHMGALHQGGMGGLNRVPGALSRPMTQADEDTSEAKAFGETEAVALRAVAQQFHKTTTS